MPGTLLKFEKRYSVKIGGRRYPVVKIGNQLWMAENLDYADENITVGGSSSQSNAKAYYYDNDEVTYGINGYRCGLLYNMRSLQYLINNSSNIFPDGWHIPSNSEVMSLISNTGGNQSGFNLSKSGLSWASNWNGSNLFGFNLIPTGTRWGSDGNFHNLGETGQFWSNYNTQNHRTIPDNSLIPVSQLNYSTSISVRLVKDIT